MRKGIIEGTLVVALFLLVMPISTLSYADTWTCVSCLSYDDSWTEMNPVIAPSGRCDTPLVYDGESDVVIVFGGGRGSDVGPANDTWAYSYESDTWYNKSPAVAPDIRVGHMMAYDSESKSVIMFSGALRKEDLPIGHVCYNETWEYNYSSNTWTNLEPATVPTPRCYGAIAYDEESDRVILFGGILEGTTVAADTWAYDYNSNTWENMNPATRPSARFAAAMAYNSAVDKMILTGGTSDSVTGYKDTWSYDYDTNTWTNLNPSEPPPDSGMHMVYDAEDDVCIFFGEGTSTETKIYNYTSNSWSSLTHPTHPPWREQAAVAYDENSDRTILFGGKTGSGSVNRLNDTWAFDYQAPPTTTTTTTTTPTTEPPPPIDPRILIAIAAGAVVLILVIVIFARKQ
ncbi:MAG: Kelch repeat-containing protein [Candidatus Thorarchaeota archaeon]